MLIRLGYACISNVLNLSSSKTITLSYYKRINNKLRKDKINNIIENNLDSLCEIIKYNIKNDIHFFRITAKLIPLMDIVDIDLSKYKNKFNYIGKLIRDSNMRVSTHIDQYCVLNSINNEVVLNSINLLNDLVKVMDMFNIKYDLIMHVGSKSGGIKQSIDRFINNFNLLDVKVKRRIVLENDDKSFNVYQTLKLCEKLNIPMCLDIHHHYCNKCSKDICFYIDRIYNTWNNRTCKIHISSMKSKKEYRAHNNYINYLDFIKLIDIIRNKNINTDIMLEAKEKDIALFKLVMELKYRSDFKFIDNSSFIV